MDEHATPFDPAGPIGDAGALITVYWRPGCPFCMSLRAGLRRSRTPYQAVNIWEDPTAAAFVRSVANGNETVPTVTVGDTWMVNPSARQVRRAAAEAGVITPGRRWFRRGGSPPTP